MATRVDAETTLGMLSDIDTEPESEDRMYDGIDTEDSVSSREICDDGFENDEENSDDENDNLADSSDESEEEPVVSPGSKGGGRGAVR